MEHKHKPYYKLGSLSALLVFLATLAIFDLRGLDMSIGAFQDDHEQVEVFFYVFLVAIQLLVFDIIDLLDDDKYID